VRQALLREALNGVEDFSPLSSLLQEYSSLDLRWDLLRMSDLCSILRSGASHTTMLIKTHKPTFLAETAVAVSALPCFQRVDANWRPGYVLALGGSSLR
jgi:hypothetical protein